MLDEIICKIIRRDKFLLFRSLYDQRKIIECVSWRKVIYFFEPEMRTFKCYLAGQKKILAGLFFL